MTSTAAVAAMIRQAESHADNMSKDRIRAVEYYQGIMSDTKSDKGKSAMVSRDVRAQIKKVLPSIMRTILGGGRVVEYQPVGQGDEDGAEQASDYVGDVVMTESGGAAAIEAAIHDALLLRNGILKWWFDERKTAKISEHTGLPDDAFAQLVADDAVEVLEHTTREDATDAGPVTVHDAKIKRVVTQRDIRVAAVPRERFLVHPDAVTLDDSILTGEKTRVTRSDLVSMGYDRERVWALSQGDDDDDAERDIRRNAVSEQDEATRANEQIDYYEVFVRFDADGDGISELRRMCFAGGLGESNLMLDDDADEVQFCDLKVMAQPHQWEGISLFDDMADIQRVKTVLLRQTLDNLYWQNNLQPVMQDGVILNPEAVFNPEFGLPIKSREGTDVRTALGFNQVPFVAKESFAMLAYMDEEAQERTGVTDASAGLAPDALQNMTAKASAMIEQAGIGQAELMVRTLAQGLRVFFRGLLRLVVKHQDVPRTVRLRGKWVQFDPRQWNSDMDCTVNTGLGAGTRERDMQVMQQVMLIQEKILAGMGPKIGPMFVNSDNLYSTLERLVESAGLRTPELYFTKPDPAAIQQTMDAAAQAPSPEMMKVQAQVEADKAKLAADQQIAQSQGQLDMAKAQAENQMAQQKMQMDGQLAQAKMQAEMDMARQQMVAEFALKREQMAMEFALKREQMTAEMEIQKKSAANTNVGDDVQFGGAVG